MWRQLRQLARLGLELPSQLRRPVGLEESRERLRSQQRARAEHFLAAAHALIYDAPRSPFRALLHWAGCEWSDLRERVNAMGIEAALAQLRDAGVYLTLEEFKRQVPISRPGLTLEPIESDFDSPLSNDGAIEGTTSGTRSRPSRVSYTWPFITDEAAHELLLYASHGVASQPVALWYPVPPGVAGLHNVLMDAKRGHAAAKWFSQIDPATSTMSRATRVALPAIRLGGRAVGLRLPAPEFADLAHADRVLDWIRAPCVVRGFASSLVRLASVALERGRDLTGVTLFSGGEPLTDVRRSFIESTGARVFPRYLTTEIGLISAGCPHRSTTDAMHVFTDRVAIVPSAHGLLLSGLTAHSGKVLLNTNLGDTGELSERDCTCEFGALGFTTHIGHVRSQQRLTLEGMTVLVSDFDAAVNESMRRLGGPPDACQYRRDTSARGLDVLRIAISPAVDMRDERAFIVSVYDALRTKGAGVAMAADLWQQADVINVVREQPQLTAGSKLRSL